MAAFFTPQQVAEELGVDDGKVLRWIDAGELVAVNVAAKTTSRPRWRIAASAYQTFLSRRESRIAAEQPRKAKKRPAGEVIEFY